MTLRFALTNGTSGSNPLMNFANTLGPKSNSWFPIPIAAKPILFSAIES